MVQRARGVVGELSSACRSMREHIRITVRYETTHLARGSAASVRMTQEGAHESDRVGRFARPDAMFSRSCRSCMYSVVWRGCLSIVYGSGGVR